MKWEDLIKDYRFGCPKDKKEECKGRNKFQRDFDRLVFSNEFRKLHGKTQVFPFPENDFIHTRMTHSLESVSVGRSLGNIVGERIFDNKKSKIIPEEIGSIVSAACLAHDIGNPPFGHSGEDAVRYFFNNEGAKYLEDLSLEEKADFQKFESNAMTFHMLTYSNPKKTKNNGGLGLTYPTLAALVKYPRLAHINDFNKNAKSESKPGILKGDLYKFREIADSLKIKKKSESKWHRYPLAFLVEAADDICYRIMDLEDGFKHGLVKYDVVEELLYVVIKSKEGRQDIKAFESSLSKIIDINEKVGYLRAKAINSLVTQVADKFIDKEKDILTGKYDENLCNIIDSKETLENIEELTYDEIFSYKSVVEIEAAGYKVLPDLLDIFLSALETSSEKRSKKILDILPDEYRFEYKKCPYQSILSIVKYVIGMTDNYAVDVYRKLNGIEIPNY
jgi:dGTPase